MVFMYCFIFDFSGNIVDVAIVLVKKKKKIEISILCLLINIFFLKRHLVFEQKGRIKRIGGVYDASRLAY